MMDKPLLEGWVGVDGRYEPSDAYCNEAVKVLLQRIGEDPTRQGLVDTPKRVVKALLEMTQGYRLDPALILGTVFEESYDEVVILKGCPFVSLCEHHVLPFTGVAHVGYLP